MTPEYLILNSPYGKHESLASYCRCQESFQTLLYLIPGQIFRDFAGRQCRLRTNYPSFHRPKKRCLTIGVFDGVSPGTTVFNLQSGQAWRKQETVKLRCYFPPASARFYSPRNPNCYTCALSRNVSAAEKRGRRRYRRCAVLLTANWPSQRA